MPPSALPPPGWYADPAGQHGSRWWDGTTWTDHVRAGAPSDDPPPVPGAPDPTAGAAPLPLSMSRRGRAVAVIASAALVLGLVATAAIGLRQGTGGRQAATEPLLDRHAVAARADAAGCAVIVDGRPVQDRDHLDPGDAPPPDVLYPQRPAHSGRHYGTVLSLPQGIARAPIDERAVLHNMEHGAVVVWIDPATADRDAIADWRDARAGLGFVSRAGGAVFASPTPPEIDDAPAVALRAWGVAIDCERFDPVVADAFLVDHWGSHGAAPEAELSPFPEGALRYRDTP